MDSRVKWRTISGSEISGSLGGSARQQALGDQLVERALGHVELRRHERAPALARLLEDRHRVLGLHGRLGQSRTATLRRRAALDAGIAVQRVLAERRTGRVALGRRGIGRTGRLAGPALGRRPRALGSHGLRTPEAVDVLPAALLGDRHQQPVLVLGVVAAQRVAGVDARRAGSARSRGAPRRRARRAPRRRTRAGRPAARERLDAVDGDQRVAGVGGPPEQQLADSTRPRRPSQER